MEMEEEVINLTKAQDPNEALSRHAIVKPRARLQKLAEHIQRLTEKYTPGTPNSQLQLLVLQLLAVKKGEFIGEVARLEAVPEQQNTTHSPPHENIDGQNPIDTEMASPLADQTINITDDRTEPPLTDNLESAQVRNSEPDVTEEKVKTLIEEFVNDAVKPWKRKIKKAAVQAIKLAETTRVDLGKENERITSVETNYGQADVLYGAYLKRTIAFEDTTSKLVDDFESVSQRVAEMERSQEETEQRLTKVDEDLGRSSTQAGSTLDSVISLEEKNATLEERNTKLEADLKTVTE
ncbi:homer protein homolog 1-like [Impatiens glandulifera]|uniref:homer protein homolog 1-like n=1 Tax=Impatiens glandulifera TaxID=253017 RepID=UPI001FB12F68|nr:homer protein homolog 1-like [Impatiens glandulifera]